MTTETPGGFGDPIWSHDVDGTVRPHEWQYLGRKAQAYRCVVCLKRVSKAELKEGTDA